LSNYYETLGVDKNAPPEDIKKAYRQLSMKYHPDHNPGDSSAEAKFKEINEAYSVLSNPSKRQEYDNPNPFGGRGPGDIFGDMFREGPFGFKFNAGPQPRRPNYNAPADGKPIFKEVKIPLKTLVFGGQFKLTLSYTESCDVCNTRGFLNGEDCEICNGSGFVQQVQRRPGFQSMTTAPCPHCQGKGKTGTDRCLSCKGMGQRKVENKEFFFDIPPRPNLGARFGQHATGRVGLNGGKRGDVVIVIMGVEKPNTGNLTTEELEQLETLLDKC
jgi:molecular chaperone DnaJ